MKTISKCILGIAVLFAVNANAALISVSGPNSSAGAAAAILPSAPASLLNSVAFNSGQEGFNERQNVVLGGALAVDGGSIAAGTAVDSHMIFLNLQDGIQGGLAHVNVQWTFSGIILGVMSDINGNLEAASTGTLGAPGSVYGAPFGARGMESQDSYSGVGTNTLTVSMFVGQPGDWIRVITAVPEPGSLALMAMGLLGLGFGRRIKS